MVGLTGCGPYPAEQAVEVKNNETAFVVPLEGDSKSKQAHGSKMEPNPEISENILRSTPRVPGFEFLPCFLTHSPF